jgi:hypothetical protein
MSQRWRPPDGCSMEAVRLASPDQRDGTWLRVGHFGYWLADVLQVFELAEWFPPGELREALARVRSTAGKSRAGRRRVRLAGASVRAGAATTLAATTNATADARASQSHFKSQCGPAPAVTHRRPATVKPVQTRTQPCPATRYDPRIVTGGQGVAGSNPAVPTIFRTFIRQVQPKYSSQRREEPHGR